MTALVFLVVILLSAALALRLALMFSKPLDNLAAYAENILKKGNTPPPQSWRILEIENLRGEVHLDEARADERDSSAECRNRGEKRRQPAIKALLSEKELILREVHHRIKNDMNVVTSLLALQAASENDPRISAALDQAQSRVFFHDDSVRSALPLGHVSGSRRLGVSLGYRRRIAAHMDPGKSIRVEKNMENMSFQCGILMSIGIIVNELLTNSYKYAFPERKGSIFISLESFEGKALLTVADDGVGMSLSAASSSKKSGFGLQLIQSLADQDRGFPVHRQRIGTRVTITFPY